MADVSLSKSQLMLLAGTANRPLAEEIAAELKQPLCQVTTRRFADGELFVKIDENVRGRDVYIIQLPSRCLRMMTRYLPSSGGGPGAVVSAGAISRW